MKVLIVGGGAREHALAWKLSHDDPGLSLLAAPGNPGIAQIARCVPASATDLPALLALARSEQADLTIVGPEAPLAAGIVDLFRSSGLTIFGPTRAAATIESSKSFAKTIMQSAGVPTARAERHTNASAAKRAVRKFGTPVVIKASGLAAGKGVTVCEREDEADQAINRILRDRAFGAAGAELLVEEYMPGEELSVLAFTDGEHVLPMLPAQDHKRLLNGDRGPNTGGMGAYAPVALGDGALLEEVTERILLPTLAALRACACQFSGVLYAGLMLTPDGPRVVEFNCRFGDPEIEALLPLLDSALLEPVLAIAQGESIEGMTFSWRDACAVTTVVAADGYPGRSRQGTPVTLPPPPDGTIVFHAGTKQSENGSLVSAGGRVLAITALADSVDAAQRASVAYAEEVQLEGKQYRTDIGWREMHRSAGTPRN